MSTLEEQGGLTLIHPFYNDEKRLELQIENWRTWSERVCRLVDIVLIDDCSAKPLELGKNQAKIIKEKKIKLSIYRIIDDLKWNTPGALNLGFTVAPKYWAMCMDSDCFFDNENMEKLLSSEPKLHGINKFKRQRYGTTESDSWLNNDRWLPCTMLMTKDAFWEIGGFDEDLTGQYTGGYGYFDNYFDICAKMNDYRRAIMEGIVAGEWLPSLSGEPVFPGVVKGDRSHVKYLHINKKIFHQKKETVDMKNRERKILRFKWEKIL